ncbi:MAG TPA: hypothetical protein VG603_01345, partial [Chitinophagales bacterium]|nr:hypothetical protein [Chitinophagales bacterium]
QVKKLAAILVLVALVAQVSSNLLVWANYEINRQYIAQNLCENRDKPCMHCNGKCYLRKQLEKGGGEHSKIPAAVLSNETAFVSEMPVKYCFCIHLDINRINLGLLPAKPYAFISHTDIFHPPAVI